MCGISGRVAFETNLHADQQALGAMGDTMAHRGPDGAGVWIAESGQAALGHQRLAVLDLEGGQQPMTVATPAGEVALTYNGEVDNAPELRRELEGHGHVFQSNSSDTEVVLRGYMQWGTGVAEKLLGMFAFAIWDDRSKELVMARDRVGIKPLCHSQTRDGVLIGSEPKAIQAHPLGRRAVGLGGWRELFAEIKTPGALIWDGVQEVKPGSVVTISKEGMREQVYWQLQSRPHTDGPEETIEQVSELLGRDVRRELEQADVPVGVLASGGLDSSSITAIAARERARQGRSIASYVIDFATRDWLLAGADLGKRDAAFADELAEMWGTDHARLELDPVQLASAALRERVVRARDMPLGLGDHDASHLLLFEEIRKRCTVALSGEMADEIFGGYNIFFDQNVLEHDGWPYYLRDPREEAARLVMLTPSLRHALDLGNYVGDAYETAVSPIERVEGESALDYRRRVLSYLSITRYAGYQLDMVDRLSMAQSLEVRVPFCGELIDYVYNVPWDIKAAGGRVKSLLKDAVHGLLPESIVERGKSPYPFIPHPHPGYLGEIQRQSTDLVAQPSHPIFEIIDHTWLRETVGKPTDQLTQIDRRGLNLALELAVWMDIYNPTISVDA